MSDESKIDIFQDPFEIGSNYVGVGSVGALSTAKPFRYAFILQYDTLLPLFSGNNKQVVLPLPPEAINQDEAAATQIQFTQNSGKYIDRRGNLSKTIVISGTTGFNYNPKNPQVVRQFMTPGAIVDAEGPTSGFAKFLILRNLFREYWSIFSDDTYVEARANAAFVFINEKDGENWYVEPMSFKMQRQSPRDKFVYRYEIVMQTIAPADKGTLLDDPTTLFQQIKNIRQIVSNVGNLISQYSAVIGSAMAAVTGAIQEATSALQNVLTQVANGLSSIADGVDQIIAIPSLIKGQADQVANSFQGAFQNWLSIGDQVQTGSGTNPIPFEAVQAATSAANLIASLAGRSELFNTSLPTVWTNNILNRYDPSYGFGGFNQLLLAPLSKSGVREVTIVPGDDLVKIATRELSSAERFMEIVVLNNLKPPYISPSQTSRLPNTLAPGDPILLPAQGSASAARAPIKTTVYTDPTFTGAVTNQSGVITTVDNGGKSFRTNQWRGFTLEITDGTGAGQTRLISANDATTVTVERAWDTNPDATSVVRFFLKRIGLAPQKSANDQIIGIDLRVKDNDLVQSADGDLDDVAGTDNMIQAINAKTSTKPGELAAHPAYGLGSEPGVAARPDSILAYKVGVRQTLLSDRRISAVQQLSAQAKGDVVRLSGFVIISGQSQPFSVDTRGNQ